MEVHRLMGDFPGRVVPGCPAVAPGGRGSPRERFPRHLNRTAAPGVINPPGGRVRRVGEGAQNVAGRCDDDRQLDALHEQLGDYLNRIRQRSPWR